MAARFKTGEGAWPLPPRDMPAELKPAGLSRYGECNTDAQEREAAGA